MKNGAMHLLTNCLFLLIIVGTSCSDETIDSSEITVVEDSIPVSRAVGSYHIPEKGGTINFLCSVYCRINGGHTHSLAWGCKSSVQPQSYSWYSVNVHSFVYATITVKANDTYMSRTANVDGIYISQSAKTANLQDAILWNTIKEQYKIIGPQGLREDIDTTCSFSLSGPYLSSNDVNFYWSVRQFDWYPIGKGTVVRGQNSPSVDIFFPFDREYGCTGVVQARIEPKANPSAGFTVEHKLAIR